jgi:hypothetical protein
MCSRIVFERSLNESNDLYRLKQYKIKKFQPRKAAVNRFHPGAAGHGQQRISGLSAEMEKLLREGWRPGSTITTGAWVFSIVARCPIALGCPIR